jgi:hypothetical protein
MQCLVQQHCNPLQDLPADHPLLCIPVDAQWGTAASSVGAQPHDHCNLLEGCTCCWHSAPSCHAYQVCVHAQLRAHEHCEEVVPVVDDPDTLAEKKVLPPLAVA